MAKELLKAKKKVWVEIIAPSLFNEELIGETYVVEPGNTLGKVVEANLMSFTGNVKHQPITIKFTISAVNGDKALTEFLRYEINAAAIRRMVRRDLNRIDSSFVCETLDKKLLRIKFIALTRNKTKSSVLKKVRKGIIDSIARQAAAANLYDLLKAVIMNKVQSDTRAASQKIYPLRSVEIRYLGLAKTGKAVEAEKPEEKPAEQPEEQLNQ